VQNRRPQLAFAACAVMVICVAVMLFLREYRVAAMIAAQAGVAFCLSYNAAKTGRKKASGIARDLRD
jgi:hypothetical protein